MNFPNFLLVFTSLLGRNDEKIGTNVMPKIPIYQNTEKNEIYPFAYEYESSLHHQITTLSSKEEIFPNRRDSCQEIITNGNTSLSSDLRTRNCACDVHCSIYKDCCEDSIHLNNELSDSHVQFSCVSTPLNGNIYMVNKCLLGYADLETIFKCETSIDSTTYVHDITLILPVTSSERNITYANSFCAVCNNETQFQSWNPVLHCELTNISNPEVSNRSSQMVEKIYSTSIDRYTILSNLVAGNGTNLISQFNDLTYQCSLFVQMPEELKPTMRHCRSNHTQASISTENLIPLDRLNLPANLIHAKMEFDFNAKFRTKINNHMRSCVYSVAKSGEPCLVNTLFSKDTELTFMENGQIFVKKYNFTFDETEYTNETRIKNTIYVCGTQLPDKNATVTAVKVFLSRSSSCLIILLLIINADKKKLHTLSDKMTYAYCITMLLVYGAFEMHRHPRWCIFTQESMHYFFLSHFFWFLAMSYELWNVICRLSVKFQSMSGKSHTKRFIVYCLLCWIIPLPVIPITMYYRKFVNIPSNCPMIAGYKIRRPCLTIPESPISLYVFFINSVIICINVSLFAHVCYHIYLTKRTNVKSTSRNNYFELFVKLALTMDLQWFFYVFSFSDIEALKVVNTMLTSSHGLITFLAYGVKKSIFISFYNKCKSYFDVVQKIRNFFAVLFGGVKRPPFLKRHSVEPSTHHTGVDLISNV